MCGILAIYNYELNRNIITNTLEQLKKLQHRGSDSFGIVYSNSQIYYTIKENIKVRDFKIDNVLGIFETKMSIGHVKYTTNKLKNKLDNKLSLVQPFYGLHKKLGEFHLVHNGNLVNLDKQIDNFNLDKEIIINDSFLLVKIIEILKYDNWYDLLSYLIYNVEGSFSLIIMAKDTTYFLKDKYSNRPLCYGINNNGYCISSESVGLGDYKFIDELEGGDICRINDLGFFKYPKKIKFKINKKCLFENIYFSNGDSLLKNNNSLIKCNDLRYDFGNELARKEKYIISQKNRKDIIVIGIPNTGIPSAKSFAQRLDLKYEQLIIKNKKYNRSFILENNEKRQKEINNKFIYQIDKITDKIIFLIDDSLVRGNTIKIIINKLKEYFPKEIHLRIPAPKVYNICKYGIDIPSKEELIMNYYNNDNFCNKYKLNTLEFLEVGEIGNSVRKELNLNINKDYCTNCFKNINSEDLHW